MTFTMRNFIAEARAAARSDDPVKAVWLVMEAAFSDLEKLRDGLPKMPEDSDDVIHFEDASMTIYQSRFRAAIEMPPHDHQISAVIGVYDGAERNDFYSLDKVDAGEAFLKRSGSVSLKAGQITGMGPNAIHTVTVTEGSSSEGIHIYLGALSLMERNVFDVKNEQILPLTEENFDALSKRK